MQKYDVVVSGGGMVGAATALALCHLGLSVAVLETSELRPYNCGGNPGLRVSAINIASQHLLERLGAWQHINQFPLCPYRRLETWEHLNNKLSFDAQEVDHTHLGHIIENDLVQHGLIKECQHDGVTIFSQTSINQLLQKQDSIEVILSDNQYIQAKLLVGADGASSRVRELANIGTTGWRYKQDCLVIGIATKFDQQDITWQEFHPSGPRAFLPLAGHFASLVWYDCPERIAELKSQSKAELKKQILMHFPKLPGDFEIDAFASFPLTRQHANDYVANRICILGDAAHTINPLAGQGVNLGFQDVMALEQTLSGALANHGDIGAKSVLKYFEDNRRYRNLIMMSAMDAVYKGFSTANPLAKTLRNIGLSMAQHAGPIKHRVLKYAMGF